MDRGERVQAYLDKHSRWRDVLLPLRRILLSAGMNETVKWGVPVYTFEGSNLVGLTAFRDFTALWFFQGALLSDPAGKLINAQEGKTRAQLQWRIKSPGEIDEDLLLQYLAEAKEHQKAGRVIRPRPKPPLVLPAALAEALAADEQLQSAFDALPPYKQREYGEYLIAAKRPETRDARLARILPMIRQGAGLNDRYRS